MGFILTFGLFLISCTVDTSSFVSVTGILPYSVRTVLPEPSWSCTRPGWQCKDCLTLQKCDSNSSYEYSIVCGDQFPSQKYCSTSRNECVSDKNQCEEFRNGFICPNRGIYPDLEDCAKYISCAYKGDIGVTYNCLFNSTYNHNKSSCLTEETCYTTTADCGGKHKMIPYKPDDSLYVVCRGLDSPLLKDCGSKALRFNAVLMECEFQCEEEGYFAHPTNPKNYYICVWNGETLVRVEKTCRDGTIYYERYGCACALETTTSTTSDDITTAVPSTTPATSDDITTPAVSEQFICPAIDGSYPDPINCHIFHTCENKSMKSGKCCNSYFNLNPPSCKQDIPCISFSPIDGLCRDKIGSFVTHPLDKSIFVFCQKFPILDKCPGDHEIFDTETNNCQYDCKRSGVFPDTSDITRFYVCSIVDGKHHAEHAKCPDNYIYDPALGKCI